MTLRLPSLPFSLAAVYVTPTLRSYLPQYDMVFPPEAQNLLDTVRLTSMAKYRALTLTAPLSSTRA